MFRSLVSIVAVLALSFLQFTPAQAQTGVPSPAELTTELSRLSAKVEKNADVTEEFNVTLKVAGANLDDLVLAIT